MGPSAVVEVRLPAGGLLGCRTVIDKLAARPPSQPSWLTSNSPITRQSLSGRAEICQ